MFNLAVDWDLFPGPNPLRRVKFFQEITKGNRVLSPDEEKKLLSAATPSIQDIIVFGLNTGLRIGEILSLPWKSVNLENNLLTVFAPKTQKTREIPINKEARRILEYWALGRKNESVFYNHETGKPFVDLDAGLELACKKAGIEGITWHKLRHTFTTRLLEQGADLATVQQLLGHSTVTVTMRYAHPNLGSKRDAVAKLEGFGDNLVTVCTKTQQSNPKVSPIHSLKSAVSYT
jgi:integrase